MCTVTFIPINKTDFILTSSRDVPFIREKALFPKLYSEDGVGIMYPKDGKAGGTWIGYSSKNRLICLLNGGFVNHYATTPSNIKYRKSRGVIVLDLLKESNIHSALSDINLDNIEPFTLVIVDWDSLTDTDKKEHIQLIELVWDGSKKYIRFLPQKMHIWSSSTLYDSKMKNMRKKWFMEWQNSFCPKHVNKSELETLYKSQILNFHRFAGIGDCNVDVLMKRKYIGTVSITQVSKLEGCIAMDYDTIS